MKVLSTLLSILVLFVQLPLAAVPSQIMIIPHAETNSKGHLSEKGFERAGALAPFITLSDFLLKFGPPCAIFAARPTSHDKSTRCLQTVGPTSQLLKSPIHGGFSAFQEKKLAHLILHKHIYDSKNILICWEPNEIPSLIKALGITSPPLFPEAYDQIWVITYTSKTELSIYQQELLFGDSQ